MDNNRKNQIAALIITLLILLATIGLLVSCGLHYEWPPKDQDPMELKQDSILFGGEYVMLGNTPEPTESEQMDNELPENAEQVEPEPNVSGDDLEDNGEPAKQAPPLVSTKEPSPMKTKEPPKEEKPKKTGPATETPKTADKQTKVKRGSDATPKPDRVKDAFGKSSGTGTGKQGSPNGNSNQGELTGKPGTEGLVGYTAEYFGRPHSRYAGSVKVRVRVNARGKVIEAHAVGGTPEACNHPEVRRDCEKESLKSAFSVPKNKTTEGIGYIIWRFI